MDGSAIVAKDVEIVDASGEEIQCTYTSEERLLTVAAAGLTENSQIMMHVTASGGNMIGIRQVKANENGQAEAAFILPENSEGAIMICLQDENGKRKEYRTEIREGENISDKSLLESTIEEAKKIIETGNESEIYTVSSWREFCNAYKEAVQCFEDSGAVQKEVIRKTDTLIEKQEGLVLLLEDGEFVPCLENRGTAFEVYGKDGEKDGGNFDAGDGDWMVRSTHIDTTVNGAYAEFKGNYTSFSVWGANKYDSADFKVVITDDITGDQTIDEIQLTRDSEMGMIYEKKNMNTNPKTIRIYHNDTSGEYRYLELHRIYYTVYNGGTEEPSDTADKTALNMVIAMAEKLESEQTATGCYTEETWAAVQTALDAARAFASDENTSQEDVDSAFLELITAVNLLENAVQSVGLQAAIEGAKAILADAEGLEQYTPESVEALRTALSEAEKVYAEESADQETINAAARSLMDAVTSLVVVDVDTRLDILIQKAEELLADSDQYTSASVENLQAALDAAKLVADDRQASDEEINEAYSALAEAITSLVRKAEKSELKTALDKANAILADPGRYVDDTIAGLQAAADAAQAVYDKEDASLAEIGEAVKSLVDEILKARLLGDVDGNGAVDSADSAEVLKYAAEAQELDEVQSKAADVNGDGAADSTDAAMILEYAAEQTAGF